MATDIDEASLRLCIRLQSQDAVALIKGKNRENEQPPDIEFAAELYKFELQSLQTFYSDRALCRRLSRLGLEDSGPLRGRAEKEDPAPNKTGSTTDAKVVSKQSSISSTSDTGASASIVDEETASQSDDAVASTGSSISSTSDTSSSLEIVEETTKPLATP